MQARTLTNVEVLQLTAGHDYDLTINAQPVNNGFSIWAQDLGMDDHLVLDTRASTMGSVTILAGAGDDMITTGDVGHANIATGGGADTILGGAGQDSANADPALAIFSGGAGDDSLNFQEQLGSTRIDGGEGTDLLRFGASSSFAEPTVLSGDQITGVEQFTIFTGGYLMTEDGLGAAGNRLVFIFQGSTRFDGSAETAGGFVLEGSRADDTLIGGHGDDFIAGVRGANSLIGGDGDDTLLGGRFDDKLVGGAGADTLTGNGGGNRFTYLSISDSTQAQTDKIIDLTDFDLIDLKAVDADDKKAGNQAFHLVETFTRHRGELTVHYDAGKNRTVISGDVDGDGHADIVILATGDHSDFTNFVF
jgi:Ca2+-binding RTX toxin-like protein